MLLKQYSKITFKFTREVKGISLKVWAGLPGASKLRLPLFLDSQRIKMVRLSAKYISNLYPPEDIPGS